MTERSQSRRGFFRLFAGTTPEAPRAFSLSSFYEARAAKGEETGGVLPAFERSETADFVTTQVGTPELPARKV